MKTALIFGVTGQDGSYLSELLIKKGYKVIGVKRRSSSINTGRLTHLMTEEYESQFELVHGDITDTSSVFNLVNYAKPDEIYNLAAQSHVGVSFHEPEYTSQVDAIGTLRLLEATREIAPSAKFYQASTSELFGGLSGTELNENSHFNPRSPYAAAKLYAYYLVKQYRQAYNLSAYNGILFNHESPRRGENFVSRKITLELSQILRGEKKFIQLGNLDSIRDWGHAKDYVSAMHIMINQTQPDDYVIATGQCHSVREFCIQAFLLTGHVLEFSGSGTDEIGTITSYTTPKIETPKLKLGEIAIKVHPKYFRPLEVPHLLGDSRKFRSLTNWSPEISFSSLVEEMVKGDIGVK